MYAIIRTGGKQYRVQPGDCLKVEKLEVGLGEELDFTDVLFVDGIVGSPTVKNAKVSVVVTEHGRDPKVLVFKKKRRNGYRRTRGHRQSFTKVFVSAIISPNGMMKADSKPLVLDPAKKAERLAAHAEKMKTVDKKAEPKVKKKAAPASAKKKATKGPARKSAKKRKSSAVAKKVGKKKE